MGGESEEEEEEEEEEERQTTDMSRKVYDFDFLIRSFLSLRDGSAGH